MTFEGPGGRRVVADFNCGALTPDAGALLPHEADRAIGLSRAAARWFRDGPEPSLVEHAQETRVGQRVHGIALGYEDLNDHDDLRHAPVLGLVSGKPAAKRSDCAVLAGKSTLNRLGLPPPPKPDPDVTKPCGTSGPFISGCAIPIRISSCSRAIRPE